MKDIFLIVDDDHQTIEIVELWLKKSYPESIIYKAADGREGWQKLKNVPPHIVITDLVMPKLSGKELIQNICLDKHFNEMMIIVISGLPEEDFQAEEAAKNRLQFLSKPFTQEQFLQSVQRALKHKGGKEPELRLVKIKNGEMLFHVGDIGKNVYFVKSGKLQVFIDPTNPIAEIGPNEFVGEMAHFSGKPRSANVLALSDCELVEISSDHLDLLLFSKPAWSQALRKTLETRLRGSKKS